MLTWSLILQTLRDSYDKTVCLSPFYIDDLQPSICMGLLLGKGRIMSEHLLICKAVATRRLTATVACYLNV